MSIIYNPCWWLGRPSPKVFVSFHQRSSVPAIRRVIQLRGSYQILCLYSLYHNRIRSGVGRIIFWACSISLSVNTDLPLPIGPVTTQVNRCASLLSMIRMTRISNIHFYLYTKYQSPNSYLQVYIVQINICIMYNIFRIWFKCLQHQWLESRVIQSTLNVFYTQYKIQSLMPLKLQKYSLNTKFNHECHCNLEIHKIQK